MYVRSYITIADACMSGSRKIFRESEPNILGIKVARFNVLLELQLRTSLVISQMPVKSVNTRVGKVIFGGGGAIRLLMSVS